MKERKLISLIAGLAVIVTLGLAPAAMAAEAEYVGNKTCKMCHNKASKGKVWDAWKAMSHSKAFETLNSDAAKAIAKEKGLAKPPAEEAACLKCHVTAHGVEAERLGKKHKVEDGVGCESCHGAGGKYWKKKVMQDREASIAAGMIVPDEKTCTACHNEESPSFKAFCYHERVEQIRHLNPLKPRTPEELAAMLVCGCGDACECVHGCEEGKCGVPPKPKK